MSNSDTIRTFLDAFNRKDIDAVMACFSDDAVYHNIPTAPVHGVDAIRTSIEGYAGPATLIDWELVAIAETESGTVLTERLDRFEFGETKVELPVMGAFDFEEGKILAWRDYFDLAQFQKQMPGG